MKSSVHIRVVKSRKMRHGKVCITHGEVKKISCIVFGNSGRYKCIWHSNIQWCWREWTRFL